MHAACDRGRPGPGRAEEAGAILLVALVLAVTFGLLSMALLATHDVALRSRSNGTTIEAAERAAASGIEWAAARVVDRGADDSTTTLTLGPDVRVVVDLDPTSPPHVTATGSCRGVTVTLAAELTTTIGAPLPFAFASMSGTSRINHAVTVLGTAYVGASSTPIDSRSSGTLTMHGDLDVVTGSALPGGFVAHVLGSTRRVTAYPDPVVDTRPYETMASGAVQVHRYSGNTTLSGVTLNGVVVVELGAAQTLILRNATVNGTVVVVSSLDLLGGGGLLGTGLLPPKVSIQGTTTIVGGTTTTGNLALLAHECELLSSTSVGSVIHGVTLVDHCTQLGGVTFRGQLVTRGEVVSTAAAWTAERPVGFEPNTPIGIGWPGPSSVRISWLGRQ